MADSDPTNFSPIPHLRPRTPIVRQPDYPAYSLNDVLPTTLITMPTYTAYPSTNWQSIVASITSETSSLFSSVPVLKQPSSTALPSPSSLAKETLSSAAVIGIAVSIASIAVVCIVVGAFFFICRQSRKRILAAQGQDGSRAMMQTTSSNSSTTEARPYIREPSLLTRSPSTMTSFATHQTRTPQPPTLVSTTMDQSYFTGLDTADNMSLSDSRRLSTIASPPYTAAASMLEPPPPYRPRSVVSRENSMRHCAPPPSYGPRPAVRSTSENAVASPFDDPGDSSSASQEQFLSPINHSSNGPPARDMEEMSDVSELSYQEEPLQTRSTV